MTDPHKIYIDSCLFIDMAKYKAVMASENENERNVWLIKQFINAAKDNKIKVLTSSLSIAECTHIKGADNPSDETKRFFDTLLASGRSGVELAQPTRAIIGKARDLRWLHGIRLKGALDAIHVATAMYFECGELLTTDKKILNKRELHELGLNVCKPEQTTLLPEKYRQGDLLP
ncbi:MAG: PIN domain-containing protein [Gammaproteobacteria bacterium]|nr:PIN domain-containing protein [Gammaproteobacteria bacterium]